MNFKVINESELINENYPQDRLLELVHELLNVECTPDELFIYTRSNDLGWKFDDMLNALEGMDDFYAENYEAMETAVCDKVNRAIDKLAKKYDVHIVTVADIIDLLDIESRGTEEGFIKLYDLIESSPKTEESLSEDYMHKDFHIQEKDAREFDEWADVDEVVFYVPELKAGFETKEKAIQAIDMVVAYEKEHKDDNLRKEIALQYAQKEKAIKDYDELVRKTAQKILDIRKADTENESDVTLEEVIEFIRSINSASRMLKGKNALKIVTANTMMEIDDILDDLYSSKEHHNIRWGSNNITSNPDRQAELSGNDSIEVKEFPYYVVHYIGDAAYEPAEGGYYVDETKVDFSKGFKTLPDARKYARKLATAYDLDKVDDDLYQHEGSNVGDAEYVIVEKSKEYLSRSHRYHGYS